MDFPNVTDINDVWILSWIFKTVYDTIDAMNTAVKDEVFNNVSYLYIYFGNIQQNNTTL